MVRTKYLFSDRQRPLEKRLGVAGTDTGAQPSGPRAAASEHIVVLDPPVLPLKPVSPKREAIAAVGFGAGLGAALLVTLFRGRYRRPAPDPV